MFGCVEEISVAEIFTMNTKIILKRIENRFKGADLETLRVSQSFVLPGDSTE